MTISTNNLHHLLNLNDTEKSILMKVSNLDQFYYARIGLNILNTLEIGVYDTYGDEEMLETFPITEDGYNNAFDRAFKLNQSNLDQEFHNWDDSEFV